MKKTIFTTLFLALAIMAHAQVERNVIYQCARGNISYTTPPEKKQQKESTGHVVGDILSSLITASAEAVNPTEHHPEYADAVKEAIVGAIGSARRIQMVDGKFLPSDLAEGETAFYCDATISAITSSHHLKTWEDKDHKKHEDTEYRANITGTINIKDVRTDKIVFTHTINTSSWVSEWHSDMGKALGYAVAGMKNRIVVHLNDVFPLYASIIEGARATEKKEKEVYIDLGSQLGCAQGMHFNVFTVKTVAGKEAKKRIGQLRVTEVMGDDISLCKVQSGGKLIKQALEGGETLLITSKD